MQDTIYHYLLFCKSYNLYSDVLEIFLYIYENAETNW